jgi:enoyl-CoA hydratase/carnithine racemase
MPEPVLAERTGGIGRITLNRPEAMNAITIELARSLERALLDLGAEVDVIVIRGAGGHFCAGGDFKEVEGLRARGTDAMAELFVSFRSACAAIARVPVPVVAAVEGNAMAGGFELMQSSDIVVVRDDARIADNHANFAMVPGGGSTQRLPRLVGRQRAMAQILTGDRLSGAEAVAWGLAYRAFDAEGFDDGVEALAERLAGKSRDALTRMKHLINTGLTLPLDEGLDLELETVLEHLGGAAAGHGIEAFTRRGEA